MNMSDILPHIATIKTCYDPPAKVLKGWTMFRNGAKVMEFCPHMKFEGTCNLCKYPTITGSIPKKDECPHHSSKFLCSDCVTTKSLMPDYSVKTGQPSNLLVSGNVTSEMCSASLTQSLGGFPKLSR